MQGLHKLGHNGAHVVLGHLRMALFGNDLQSGRAGLGFVASRHLARRLRVVRMNLEQPPPIFGTRFQTPEIFRLVELRRQLPAMLARAHRLAVNHVRFGGAASLAPELHRDAGFEPGGRKYGTAMRADHQGLAYFGKGRARLQAGNGDGKGDRHSRTAPHGLRHIRTMHVVPLSWCPAFLLRSLMCAARERAA